MQARLITEKIVVRGEKMRKVLGFSGILAKPELPVEYLRGKAPWFKLAEDRLDIFVPAMLESPQRTTTPNSMDLVCWKANDHCSIYLRSGDIIPELLYQEALLWMKRAGTRLAKLNRELAEENADWHGEETVEI